MSEAFMVFLESDVSKWTVHDQTGQMQMRIELAKVLSKLPKNQKIKTARFESKEAVETEFFDRLCGVRFKNWIAMNFEQSNNG